MTENYELPVLFTEEERKAYASWGIKKEKLLMPFAIATILIYAVTAAFVVMKVWGVRDSDHVLFQMLVLGDWIPELTGVLAVLMTILLPYAFKRALSSYSNEVVLVFKSTSLAYTITLMEVMGHSQLLYGRTYDVMVFGAAGIVYLVVNGLLTLLMRLIEHKALAFERRN